MGKLNETWWKSAGQEITNSTLTLIQITEWILYVLFLPYDAHSKNWKNVFFQLTIDYFFVTLYLVNKYEYVNEYSAFMCGLVPNKIAQHTVNHPVCIQ